MISPTTFEKSWFWTAALLLLTSIITQVKCDVTFGSQPEKCQVKNVGDIMDQEEKIDCEGAMYSEIPYTSIPCNAKRINFANNNLTKLTRNSFRGLQQLEEIVLSGNRISYIEAEAFAGLPNLQTVNLVDNLLTEIDERPFWRAQFENMMLMVDGNPWYCDEDLKETVEAIEGKVTFIGLTCRGGFIRGIRGTIVGREFEDIRDRIENDFESWEIALIVSGSFAAVVLLLLIGYTVYVCKYQNEGEEANLVEREFGIQGTRESNRYLDQLSEKTASQAGGSPVSGAAVDPTFRDSRKIHITSDDHFNPERTSDNEFEMMPVRPEPPRSGYSSPRAPGVSGGFRNDSPRVSSPQNGSSISPPPRPPPARADEPRPSGSQNVNEDEIHV